MNFTYSSNVVIASYKTRTNEVSEPYKAEVFHSRPTNWLAKNHDIKAMFDFFLNLLNVNGFFRNIK